MNHRDQKHEAASLTVSIGLPPLDDLLGGILWGDNVVWEVAAGASTQGVETALLGEIADSGRPAAYVVFGRSPKAVTEQFSLPELEVLDCRDAATGVEVS